MEKEESEDRKQTFLLRTRQKSGDTDIKILVAASDNDEREKWIESIKKFSDYYPDEVSKFLQHPVYISRLLFLI